LLSLFLLSHLFLFFGDEFLECGCGFVPASLYHSRVSYLDRGINGKEDKTLLFPEMLDLLEIPDAVDDSFSAPESVHRG
jgi:hypothetical protein